MAALITNDVALIALVPLTMIIAEKAKFRSDVDCYYSESGC
jgi:hypothetical protein